MKPRRKVVLAPASESGQVAWHWGWRLRRCDTCGKRFIAHPGRELYCSQTCAERVRDYES